MRLLKSSVLSEMPFSFAQRVAFSVAAIAVCLVSVASARAQTAPVATADPLKPAVALSKNEFSVVVGSTLVPDRDISPNGGFSTNSLTFQKGTSLQLGYARRLADLPWATVSAELPVAYIPKVALGKSSGGNPSASYSALFVTPGVRLTFRPNSRIRPWGSVGGGFSHQEGSVTLLDGSSTFQSRVLNTGTVVQFGAGVDYRLNKWVSFRAEGRDYFAEVPRLGVTSLNNRNHNVVFGGGVAFHF